MEENQEKKLTNEEEKKENPNQEQSIEENQSETSLVECKSKKKRKGSYIAGTFGAIFGGCVAAIAWILIYCFSNNMVVPVFGTLIPFGAYLGYKIFKGRVGKIFPIIIAIISILIILLTTIIICPGILVIKSGYPLSLENIMYLYTDTRAEIRKVITEDTIAGLAFTIIGIISTIIFLIRKQLKALITEQERKLIIEKAKEQLKVKSKTVKAVCVTLNCMKSENAKAKKLILKELKNTYNLKRKKAKQYFILCKLAQILRKNKGKYYYDENDELNKIENAVKINSKYKSRKKIKISLILISILSIIAVVVAGIIWYESQFYIIPNTNIKLKIIDTQDLFGTPEEIMSEFGEKFSEYYDFIVMDKEEQYEIEAKLIDKSYYTDVNIDTIIQTDREYCAQITNEEMSDILEMTFANKKFRSYYYNYNGQNNQRYLAVVYLHETENGYLWVFAYANSGIKASDIDEIMKNLIK